MRKILLTLSASSILGAAVLASNAALAQVAIGGPPPGLGMLLFYRGPGPGGPPSGLGNAGLPGGPPPGLGAHAGRPGPGGAPRFSRLDRPPGFRGDRAIRGDLQRRAGGYDYGRSSAYGDGRTGWHDGRWRRYGVYVYGNSSYSSADSSCTDSYTYSKKRRAYKRVVVCD
jgi:hypothetical protein